MDLESEFSALKSVEDNEEINKEIRNLGINGESKAHSNGACVVLENGDSNDFHDDVNGKGSEVLGSEVSPSTVMARRGKGLKKWRRIKRDVSKSEDNNSVDNGKMIMQDLLNIGPKPSKRPQIYADNRKQKSEDSVSSTKAVVRNLNVFAVGPSSDAGNDSENSEDRSSRSSTAASAPKMKYEMPVGVGFQHDKSRTRSLSGNGKIETVKQGRGQRVKIEKENSLSSMESDSRSSNFPFMQGTYATSNGIRSEKPIDYDGENGVEIQGNGQRVSNGHRYEEISLEEERSQNNGSSADQDPLVEAVSALQCAEEALEKEVLKFKETGKDVLVDDLVSVHSDFTDIEQEFNSEDVLSRAVQSEVAELEDLFKQKIEAEVEYLAISRTVHKLQVAAVDQITRLEEQKSEQAQILHKLSGNKGDLLKKDAEKFEILREEIASADETLKLQKRVCKYTSYLFVQIVLLVLIFGVFILQLSPNYVEVVPT